MLNFDPHKNTETLRNQTLDTLMLQVYVFYWKETTFYIPLSFTSNL